MNNMFIKKKNVMYLGFILKKYFPKSYQDMVHNDKSQIQLFGQGKVFHHFGQFDFHIWF